MDFVPAHTDFSPWSPGLVSLAIYALMVFLLIGVILWLAGWLGEKRVNPEKLRPYECGVLPSPGLRPPHPAPFYLVAIFFLLFDVEGAFIFSWAVAMEPLGWWGWLEITSFIGVLALSLVYLWAKNGLEWGVGRP